MLLHTAGGVWFRWPSIDTILYNAGSHELAYLVGTVKHGFELRLSLITTYRSPTSIAWPVIMLREEIMESTKCGTLVCGRLASLRKNKNVSQIVMVDPVSEQKRC